jgi:hypothetical protein
MKRLFNACLVFMTILSASCTDRLDNDVTTDTLTDVTFAIDVETASLTRAISDGTGATQLMWAIFSEDGELLVKKSEIKNTNALISEQDKTLSTKLTKEKKKKENIRAQNQN